MSVMAKGNVLYHYAGMDKAIKILTYKNLRLSDITKSNDMNEMSIFIPGIFDEMLKCYDERGGFSNKFVYRRKTGKKALEMLVENLKTRITKELEEGKISTFVICFSEEGDLLSQWRGYADNGKGMCLGFSVDELMKFVGDSTETGFALEKVEYLSREQANEKVHKFAYGIIDMIEQILGKIKAGNIKCGKGSAFAEEMDEVLYYAMLGLIEESIKFKSAGFKEEKEWRFFIRNSLNKDELEKKTYTLIGGISQGARKKVSEYVADNINFNIKENDIIPYVTWNFEKFHDKIICDVVCGPNNTIRERDLELFLRKYEYKECEYRKSGITYIVR